MKRNNENSGFTWENTTIVFYRNPLDFTHSRKKTSTHYTLTWQKYFDCTETGFLIL